MNRIHDKIRKIIETTPGLTQKGLAERMDLNPAAVNRMLYGRRNIMAEEIPVIEDYLGVRLDITRPPINVDYPQQAQNTHRRGFAETPSQEMPRNLQHMLPVYGRAGLQKELDLAHPTIVDWVVRPPALLSITNAFAIYIFSDAMAPRYFQGELIYLHPGRPLEAGRDCLIEVHDGSVEVARFAGQNDTQVFTTQFNPQRDNNFLKKDIRSIYAVVGRG